MKLLLFILVVIGASCVEAGAPAVISSNLTASPTVPSTNSSTHKPTSLSKLTTKGTEPCLNNFCEPANNATDKTLCAALTVYEKCVRDPKPSDCKSTSKKDVSMAKAKTLQDKHCVSLEKQKECKKDFCASTKKLCTAFTAYKKCMKQSAGSCTKDSKEPKKLHKQLCGGCGAVAVQISLLVACLMGVFTKTQFF